MPTMRTMTSAASVRRCASFASVIVALGMLSGCEDEPAPAPLFPEDYAETYRLVRNCRSSIDHDLVYIEVLVNPAAESAYVDGVYPFAPGTTLVKREHADAACSQRVGFTAMRRLEAGASPDGADWEWQELDAERNVIETGALPQCVGCHQSCTEGRDLACTDP
jgi:hypothetical protein